MQNNFLPVLSVLALLATGCTDKATEAAPVSGQPAVSTVSVTAPVPVAKSVLADVYQQTVTETTGSQLSDGRYASYWSGQQFTSEGKNYFVAFTESTPPSEIEYPAPEDKVSISQATYELVGSQWQLKNVQDDVGQFGGNNKAPAFDVARETIIFKNVQGNLFLATPSVVFANMGIQLFSDEVFVFSPESGKWKYLGSIEAGSDNTAGCSHEADSAGKTKCAISKAKLNFSAIDNSNWPELKVALEGTELDDDGNLITLSGKDSVSYRYDEKSSAYKEVDQ